MSLLLLFLQLSIIRDTLTYEHPLLILKNPLISSIKVFPENKFNYTLKGDTLFIKDILGEKDTLYIEYESLDLKEEYFFWTLKYPEMQEFGEKSQESKIEKEEAPSSFRFSGNQGLGFSTGTDGFRINQSTRVEIGGELREGFSVDGIFQDQGLPSENGGTTREISELETAYLRMKSNFLIGNIGEFFLKEEKGKEISSSGLEEKGIERKILGMSLNFKRDEDFLQGGLGYGTGKFESVYIQGQIGFQGPYIIPIQYGENIVPSSERVYLDGILLTQGKNRDYTIDYERATITFNPAVTITQNSRIRIDFEKATRGYDRIFALTKFNKKMGNQNLSILYFQETDDKRRPLFTLSESDKSLLKEIGDTSAVFETQGYEIVDSGKGDYILKGDTLVYVGSNKGNVKAYFIFVGSGNGNYIYNDVLGGFQFVGDGHGEYKSGKILYIPERSDYWNFSLQSPFYKLSFYISNYDRNTFSKKGNGDNFGKGGETQIKIEKNLNLILLGLKGNYRNFDARLKAPLRTDEIERPYLWDLRENKGAEIFLGLVPYTVLFKILRLEYEFGDMKKGEENSRRNNYIASFSKFFDFSGNYENIRVKKDTAINWTNRYTMNISKKIGFLTPNAGYFYEKKQLSRYEEKSIGFNFFDNIFFTKFKEARKFGNAYFLISELGHTMSFKRILRSTGIIKFQREKTLGQGITRNIFYQVQENFTPFDFFSSTFLLYRNENASFEKIVEYIYVGKGNGNFSYDSLTGTFFHDPDGDYLKKEYYSNVPQKVIEEEYYATPSFYYSKGDLRTNLGYKRKNALQKKLFEEKNLLVQLYSKILENLKINQDLEIQERDDALNLYEPIIRRFFDYKSTFTILLKKNTLEAGYEYKEEREKEKNNIEREIDFTNKIIIGLSPNIRGRVNFQIHLGKRVLKSPFYEPGKKMDIDFFSFIPNIGVPFFFSTNFSLNTNFIVQRVKGELSRTSFLDKEKWRIEWNFEIKKMLKNNFELSAGYTGRRGEKSYPRNTFKMDVVASF